MPDNLEFYDLHPVPEDFFSEVLEGLSRTPKSIHPKFFYDERGSFLFRQITLLPEYYLTRAETRLLKKIAPEIASLAGPGLSLVEYGCGSSEKIKILLKELVDPLAYTAIDISQKSLLELGRSVASSHPEIWVKAVCADFTDSLKLPTRRRNADDPHQGEKNLAFFPGSSIGNFEPDQAAEFLTKVRKTVGKAGALLIGVDLKKDSGRLHAAYNDSAGVTARFNLNLLERVNRECGADFSLSHFKHNAFYNQGPGRIEMHLISLEDQSVRLNGTSVHFKEGESIHTENSYKYSLEEFQSLGQRSGWRPVHAWTDPEELFSVHYFKAQ